MIDFETARKLLNTETISLRESGWEFSVQQDGNGLLIDYRHPLYCFGASTRIGFVDESTFAIEVQRLLEGEFPFGYCATAPVRPERQQLIRNLWVIDLDVEKMSADQVVERVAWTLMETEVLNRSEVEWLIGAVARLREEEGRS